LEKNKSKQQKLFSDEIIEDIDHLSVIWRKVIEKNIKRKELTQESIKKNTLDLLNSLITKGKTITFDKADLKENDEIVVKELLKKYTKRNSEHLLRSLIEDLKTQQRSENKHTVLYYWKNWIFICHSTIGEKTIINEEENGEHKMNVVTRFIDKDNVDRFVAFSQKNKKIELVYREFKRSSFFHRWLGIKDEKRFKFSENRFFTTYCKLPCVFELTDEDVEQKLLNSKDVILRNNLLEFPGKVKFKINSIKSGNNEYKKVNRFLDDFKFRSNDLKQYTESFQRFCMLSLTEKIVDNENNVIQINDKEKKILKQKENEDYLIVYRNETISIAGDFLEKIVDDFCSLKKIKLFHAGMQFSSYATSIGTIEIFNKLQDEITNITDDHWKIINLLNEEITPKNGEVPVINDGMFKLLAAILFDHIGEILKQLPIQFLFKDISQLIANKINNKQIIQKEKATIEYKARDWFLDNDKENIDRFSNDLKKKLEKTNIIIYLIGIDQQLQKIDPIPYTRIVSERLEKIESGVLKKLNSLKKEVNIFSLDSIRFDDSHILVMKCTTK